MATRTLQPGAYCHNIDKKYRVGRERIHALGRVNKEFPRGSLTMIAGPSGSGKSSLLRLLACVDRPDTGALEVGGAGRRAVRLGCHPCPRRARPPRRDPAPGVAAFDPGP